MIGKYNLRAKQETQLVSGKQLLEELWAPESRPSMQWLRQHTGEDIPATKVGRLYFYDRLRVREALGMMHGHSQVMG